MPTVIATISVHAYSQHARHYSVNVCHRSSAFNFHGLICATKQSCDLHAALPLLYQAAKQLAWETDGKQQGCALQPRHLTPESSLLTLPQSDVKHMVCIHS